ncbi:hypothetical protein L596_026774 [Steinernema carpocapsae]|uniref:Uncharacterized protein n=1 Tax=Steinernema carpocapsae TaxID=34508 RepID=A0A4U5M2E6_STECR|nr:hypothetical protein L596_026774 [Steinernema carpocapsae]
MPQNTATGAPRLKRTMRGFFSNVDHGCLEALVRGFKTGILNSNDSVNLIQCETLEDVKLHVQSTDYENFVENEPGTITMQMIDERLKEKLATEFTYIRNNCLEPLSTFLDYITYSYMIDNVILLITGARHQRPIMELITKCHPLGSFEQIEAIHIASTPAEHYNAVLLNTPLAPHFVDCISKKDLDVEIIRSTLSGSKVCNCGKEVTCVQGKCKCNSKQMLIFPTFAELIVIAAAITPPTQAALRRLLRTNPKDQYSKVRTSPRCHGLGLGLRHRFFAIVDMYFIV